MPSPQELIAHFDLRSHPEGGYYAETYRAARGADGRSHATAIYFLLPAGESSKLHRLKSDEGWHFHLGGALIVAEIDLHGKVTETRLGNDVLNGEKPQHVVPAGRWFGAYAAPGTAYSFVSCTVSPGFEFEDFEMAERGALTKAFPHAAALIHKLT